MGTTLGAASFATAEVRWCLTGTPIQNKLEDVFAYLAFLRLEPLSDYAWFHRMVPPATGVLPQHRCKHFGDKRGWFVEESPAYSSIRPGLLSNTWSTHSHAF